MKSRNSQQLLKRFTWLKWVFALIEWVGILCTIHMAVKFFQTINFIYFIGACLSAWVVWLVYEQGVKFRRKISKQLSREYVQLRRYKSLKSWVNSKVYHKKQAKGLIK